MNEPSSSRPREIAPSLLAADLADLAGAARAVEGAADRLHFDVMDGQFVPNLTMGAPVLAALHRHTQLPLDAHLMVNGPDDQLEAFAKAGASEVTVHVEAAVHLHRTLERIRNLNMKAGVAINPGTDLSFLPYVFDVLDSVLIMTVEPGFGGQQLIRPSLEKIRLVRGLSDAAGRQDLIVAVDGGVNEQFAHDLVALGADRLVAGTAVFSALEPAAAIERLRKQAWPQAASHVRQG